MTLAAFPAIDAALMQALLAERYPGLRVHGVAIEGAIHGTATKVRVRIEADGEGPRVMWVKGGWEESSEVLRGVGIFSREPRVYAELLAGLAMETPRCFGATWDEAKLDGIVLLEDLAERGACFNTPLDALSVDEVRRMLTGLAQMHATTMDDDWQAEHRWLRKLFHDAEAEGSYLNYVSNPATLAQYLAMPRGNALPDRAKDPQAISAAMRATVQWAQVDPLSCMIHGDAHIGNTYCLPDGTPGMLDWQCVWRGGPAYDVAYYIASSLAPEERRAHEVALIAHYLGEFSAAGGPSLDPETFFGSYRRYLAYGLTVWLTNSPTFQAEDYNAAVSARFAAALIDHGML